MQMIWIFNHMEETGEKFVNIEDSIEDMENAVKCIINKYTCN